MGAGLSGAFGSLGAGNQVNELQAVVVQVVVPSRTITWRTTV